MNQYSAFGESKTIEQETDVVTLEEFNYDEKAHPRAVITIRRENGVPFPHLVSSVLDIINRGNGQDPTTRRPFSDMVKTRANLYARSLIEFPEYTRETMDCEDLYKRWVYTYQPDCKLSDDEKEKTRMEAQCFLQPEDLMGVFSNFFGSGSLENRTSAVAALSEATSWILRKSSVVDTEYDKAYALTKRTNRINHFLIIHRLGEGFYFNCYGMGRGDPANGQITDHQGFYPTIIHLLQDQVQLGPVTFTREVSYSQV